MIEHSRQDDSRPDPRTGTLSAGALDERIEAFLSDLKDARGRA